ncbi:MAG: signal peptide peptidase SppA [Alphaproteobacteria bacterium]|nr:signal peptide peptidase SppA [Alphaproteobacteria bacterium]
MSQLDDPIPPPPVPPRPRRSALGVLLVVTLAAFFLFAAAIGVVVWLVERADRGDVEDGSFLHVHLAGELPSSPQRPSFFEDPADAAPTITEIARAIRHASSDERIEGLYLELDGPQAGWGGMQEIRAAVRAFVDAGKPCVAYSPSVFTNGSYYLATACPTVGMAPAGVLLVNGLSVELLYYKEALARLGVQAEYEHVGDFKSAIEPFERDGPSAPAAAAYEGLLDSLYAQMVDGIAAGRSMTSDEVRASIDDPTLVPRTAVERGLLDVLAWPDAMEVRVHEAAEEGWAARLEDPLTDDDASELTPLKEYVKELRADVSRFGARIAVIHASGSIVSGDGQPSLFGDDGLLTDGAYARWMEEVREDDNVKAVVVRVDSPGGSALASSLMWRDNARTMAAGKPLVVSMGDYAASGGYLMSANADWVVAAPGTLTGSIGVFGGKLDLSGTMDKLGIGRHAFQRGRMADLLSLSSPFDDDERVVFRAYLEEFYGQFLDIVSTGRGLERDAVHEVAQGRVWTGEQALDHELVDALGTLDDAVAKAAELANLEDYQVVDYPKRRTFFELLMEDFEDAAARTVTVDVALPLPEGEALRRELSVLEHASREGGALMLLPGLPTVR